MKKSSKKIIVKNIFDGLIGAPLLGSIPAAIVNTIYELNRNKDDESAKEILTQVLNELVERIQYIESHRDDYSDEISIEFNMSLEPEQYKKFEQLLSDEGGIPIGSECGAEMFEDFNGIDIHLDESISGFEICKVRGKMNDLLKKIDPKLEVLYLDPEELCYS